MTNPGPTPPGDLYREARRALGTPAAHFDDLGQVVPDAAPEAPPGEAQPPFVLRLVYRVMVFVLVAVGFWLLAIIPVAFVGGAVLRFAEDGPFESLLDSIIKGAFVVIPVLLAARVSFGGKLPRFPRWFRIAFGLEDRDERVALSRAERIAWKVRVGLDVLTRAARLLRG